VIPIALSTFSEYLYPQWFGQDRTHNLNSNSSLGKNRGT
jgi:hypothetical protein